MKPSRSFDPETGALVEADGVKRLLSDDEMARYWDAEKKTRRK